MVFHNVCSGDTVLFLGLCDLVSKGRHKATTRNGVSQGEGRARYTPLKRYFIMFVRGTPCSSWVCVIWSVKGCHKATTRNCVSQGIFFEKY